MLRHHYANSGKKGANKRCVSHALCIVRHCAMLFAIGFMPVGTLQPTRTANSFSKGVIAIVDRQPMKCNCCHIGNSFISISHAKCTPWQCPQKARVLHSILRQRIVINKIVRIIAFKNSIHATSSAIQCNIVQCSIASRSGNLMCALLFKSHWTCKIIILLICNFRLVSTWLDSYFQFLFAFFSARSIREEKKERVCAHTHTHGWAFIGKSQIKPKLMAETKFKLANLFGFQTNKMFHAPRKPSIASTIHFKRLFSQIFSSFG